jgi:hypothetical protein
MDGWVDGWIDGLIETEQHEQPASLGSWWESLDDVERTTKEV